MIVSAALLSLFVSQAEAPAAPRPESTTLFDGATLAGWSGDPRFWSVEDGAIVGRSTPDVPCERSTHLLHDDLTFTDFDLTVDYWIEGGNSGVQFRSVPGPDYQVTGYQADLDAPGDWTGGLYDQGGRGIVNRRAVRMVANGPNTAYELLGDPAELSKLGGPGAWHALRIRAQGSRIALWIDGTLTCEYDDREAGADFKGCFALQLHKGPPMEVRFRDFRIERLVPEPEPKALPNGTTPAGGARWIWDSDEPEATGLARFTRTVKARGPITRATLWATCDNGVEFSLDDIVFAGGELWSSPFTVELPPRLRKRLGNGKKHRVAATCWNQGGAAGLIARLELEYEDGSTDFVETDRFWKSEKGLAAELGRFGAEPWGVPEGTSAGVPDLPLPAAKLQLPAGFEASEILRVPRAYGSWVALTADAKGRLICAAENGPGIYRVTLDESGIASTVEDLDIDVHAAQGLLARGDDLYIVRNAWPPEGNGLYRARDTNGDDQYDALTLLTPFEGGGEHGPHAVRLSPDGEHLEVIAGNSTKVPAGVTRYHMPANWHDDQLLPSLPDTFGHGNTMHLHGGWLGRCNFDGGEWEILCAGLRNTYDFAYDRSGERFGYDADMEWDIGAPWYRAPRILHLVPGAEYGWRRGSGKIDDAEPDNFGSVCTTGPASPVGVLHGKGGTFHGAWGDALYAADWTRGVIHAVTLEPDGDTFRGVPKPFVVGTPLPITDMTWLPDGSMAIATGGRGRRSALYRVRSNVERAERETLPPSATGPGSRAALTRRLALELDPNVNGWSARALESDDTSARLALARSGGKDAQPALRAAVSERDGMLTSDDLRILELSLARWGAHDNAEATALAARVEADLPPASDDTFAPLENDVKRAELLVYLGSNRAPAFAVPRMENAATQERALDFAMALRRARTGWTDALARRALDVLHTVERPLRGGRSIEGYFDRARDELRGTVDAFLDGTYDPPKREVTPTSTRRLEAPTFVQEWTMTQLAPTLASIDGAKDRALGRLSFERAGCFVCHRVGNEGGGTGPDLSTAATRFTPRDLALAILEPSRDISDQYRDTEVWTTDGEVYVGRLTEQTDAMTTLQLPPSEAGGSDGELVDIEAEDIQVQRPHPNSRMPSGTLDGLRTDEILEMLAWLLDPATADGN